MIMTNVLESHVKYPNPPEAGEAVEQKGTYYASRILIIKRNDHNQYNHMRNWAVFNWFIPSTIDQKCSIVPKNVYHQAQMSTW